MDPMKNKRIFLVYGLKDQYEFEKSLAEGTKKAVFIVDQEFFEENFLNEKPLVMAAIENHSVKIVPDGPLVSEGE